MRNFVLSAFAAGALLASPAQAVTVSDMLPLQDVNISGTLTVQQFNPMLGNLTGIMFEITGEILGSLTVTNFGTNPISGTATTDVDFNLTSVLLPLAATPDFTVSSSVTTGILAPGEMEMGVVSGMQTISGSIGPLNAFIGTGTVDVLDFFTVTNFSGSGFGGDILIQQITDAGIKLDITYEFDAVAIPLPATAPLLVAAAGLFLFVGRKRTRRLS